MTRIKLTIAYDGTNYSGWQIQNNGITIQQIVQEACYKLFSREIILTGASRTDSGVHAVGQVAVFDIDTRIPPNKIAYALNVHLPSDIVIQNSEEVSLDFHPRYNAREKTYIYKILNQQFSLPQYRLYSTHVPKQLDVNVMQNACCYFVGEHDFKSFCSVHTSVRSTIRTIYECRIIEEPPFKLVYIRGNGFLYNMVRIITGTLIDVGLGRLDAYEVENIINSKERTLASATAPAKGLTLIEIKY